LEPPRGRESRVEGLPRRWGGLSDDSRTRLGKPACQTSCVLHLERDPNVAGYSTADLYFVDERCMYRVGQLKRRPARLKNGHASAGRGIRRPLAQAKDIAVKVQCIVVVGSRYNEAQLKYRCWACGMSLDRVMLRLG
jgi:hypothetical protein